MSCNQHEFLSLLWYVDENQVPHCTIAFVSSANAFKLKRVLT